MTPHRHRDWWACRPGTELLEGRRLPAQFGVPWHDALHLSVSFVPDGTPVASHRSDLFARLDAVQPTTDWQREVLRAFQTWAVEAHINFAVQPDAGLPLGTPGPDQHDPRFGDVRIGAQPMSPEVLSISVPHDPFLSGTWSGDVLLNSAAGPDGSKADLFPVLLHEVGHVLGLDHSDDPGSVMSSHLNNRLVSLSPGDIAAVRSLYGARPGDGFEGPGGNRDITTASPVPIPAGYDGSTPLLLYADVTTSRENDFFSLKAPAGYRGPATVRLQSAGVSLLAPRLTIFDAAGNEIADAASVRVGGDTLQITLPAVEPGATYYAEVRGASDDVFGVGEYALAVNFDGRSTVGSDAIDRLARQSYGYLSADDIRAIFLDPAGALFHDDRHTDDTFETSAPLDAAGAYGSEAPDRVTASLADPSDVNVYHVDTPESPHDGLTRPLVMTVTGRATEVNGLMPRVAVFDADRNPVPSLVLAHGDGTYTIQVAGVRPDSEYFVEVRHDPTSGKLVGNYELDVEYGHTAAAPTGFVESATGGRAGPQSYALVVNEAQLFDFLLAAGPGSGRSGSAVRMSVVDATGRTVGVRTAGAGETAGGDPWLLLPGDYTVTFAGVAPGGLVSSPLSFRLYGGSLSDPIGPALDDSTLRPVARRPRRDGRAVSLAGRRPCRTARAVGGRHARRRRARGSPGRCGPPCVWLDRRVGAGPAADGSGPVPTDTERFAVATRTVTRDAGCGFPPPGTFLTRHLGVLVVERQARPDVGERPARPSAGAPDGPSAHRR